MFQQLHNIWDLCLWAHLCRWPDITYPFEVTLISHLPAFFGWKTCLAIYLSLILIKLQCEKMKTSKWDASLRGLHRKDFIQRMDPTFICWNFEYSFLIEFESQVKKSKKEERIVSITKSSNWWSIYEDKHRWRCLKKKWLLPMIRNGSFLQSGRNTTLILLLFLSLISECSNKYNNALRLSLQARIESLQTIGR